MRSTNASPRSHMDELLRIMMWWLKTKPSFAEGDFQACGDGTVPLIATT